ncbi:FecR family protein [Chitinophaga qingshengii]|uniref:FecR domain-containing protein n=1 Tax=Chitinophaga qingshengii TaxID=1569794 RepID=A0ABR7TNN3_9BACT|nr:FecR domain-containing protein [Chitinophaga qingshengii]MBC9932077.1 FecR domain-containing protein [Chitinophaga qingshengii]
MDYHLYTKNDFLEDASVRAYVKGEDPAAARFWEQWLAQQPPNSDAFRDATFLLRHLLSGERIHAQPGTAETLWQHITAAIDTTEATPVRRIRPWWWAAAAIALLLTGSGLAYYLLHYTGTQTIYAAYGKKERVTLPDASVVTLNANSSLRYAKHWGHNGPREVWLSGEAYFEVQHQNGGGFRVHTGQLDIEVLGTAFNVKQRRGITTVFLEKGAVKVDAGTPDKSLVMKPGEEVQYRQQEELLTKYPGDAGAAAWMDNKMILHNTSVKEIVQVLEDTYGYKVMLSDTSIANRRINGELPLKNTQTLLYILSNMLDVSIEVNKADSTLLFKPGQ